MCESVGLLFFFLMAGSGSLAFCFLVWLHSELFEGLDEKVYLKWS